MLVSSVSASAYSGTGESRTYTYNGYTVEYKVVNEWTGNQNIEITVTNTGDEILADWAMGYNASGEINGLWNAQVYAVQGTEYILKGASYNSEIAPNESVRFGYILSGEEFKYPQNIFNCAKRVDISDNYDVYYNIVGDYGDTYQAEMVIENLSDTDYSAWRLSFDGNATIDNLWNAKLLENNEGGFKVKNAEHNSVIYAGDSVSFNFGGTKLTGNNVGTEDSAETATANVTKEVQPDITYEKALNSKQRRLRRFRLSKLRKKFSRMPHMNLKAANQKQRKLQGLLLPKSRKKLKFPMKQQILKQTMPRMKCSRTKSLLRQRKCLTKQQMSRLPRLKFTVLNTHR